MITLHEAVHETANKLLDKPTYVKFPRCSTKILRRAYALLKELGYAEETWGDRKGKYPPPRIRKGHPKAIEYLKLYGEQYVLMLEATQRLVS
jgi:hypothetical protein